MQQDARHETCVNAEVRTASLPQEFKHELTAAQGREALWMQWAESEVQIAQSLHLEAQAALRANREPDVASRAEQTEPIGIHLKSDLDSRAEEVVKLENTLPADRHG